MKTVCTLFLFTVLLGLPALAQDTGSCIDPMGCPSDGDQLGSQLDPNGVVFAGYIEGCQSKWNSCELGCYADQNGLSGCLYECYWSYVSCVGGKPQA